jgi:hypothetical protein
VTGYPELPVAPSHHQVRASGRVERSEMTDSIETFPTMAAACDHYAHKGYTEQQRYQNGNVALLNPSGAGRVELWHTVDGKVRAADGPLTSSLVTHSYSSRPRQPQALRPPHRRSRDFSTGLLVILFAPFALVRGTVVVAYAAGVMALVIGAIGAVLYGMVWVLHALWRAT